MYPSGSKNPWTVPRLWPDSTVFVLGSGPSMKTLEGSDLLRNKHIIAVHYAFLVGSWVDVLFMGDARCYWELQDKIDAFKGLKISLNIHNPPKHKSTEDLAPDIKIINMQAKPYGLITDRTKVCYNGGAGAAAINLAYHLGAKRIILFGFDMKMKNGKRSYFPSIHQDSGRIAKWNQGKIWSQIVKDCQRLKVEIFNATPDSALKCIPKIKLGKIL